MNFKKKDNWKSYWDSKHRSFIEQKIQSYKARNGYAELLHSIPEIEFHGRVLEIGGGKAFMSRILRDSGCHTTAIDFDYNIARTNCNKVDRYIVGNMLNLPFKNDSFDFVISCGLIEHFTLDVVKEIFLESKRVGKVVIAWFPSCGMAWRIMWNMRNLFGGNVVTEAYTYQGKVIENILKTGGFRNVKSGSVLFGGIFKYLYVYGAFLTFPADNAAKEIQ